MWPWSRKPKLVQPCREQHPYGPFISVNPMELPSPFHNPYQEGRRGLITHTVALRRCNACGIPQTVAMLGTWSLDQMNGLSAAEVAESFLKS